MAEALIRQALSQSISGCAPCTNVPRRWLEHSRMRAPQDKGRGLVCACQLHRGASEESSPVCSIAVFNLFKNAVRETGPMLLPSAKHVGAKSGTAGPDFART